MKKLIKKQTVSKIEVEKVINELIFLNNLLVDEYSISDDEYRTGYKKGQHAAIEGAIKLIMELIEE
jgi:hypothetical protein